jgi:pyrroloquinoline quinone biosynthesis protein E
MTAVDTARPPDLLGAQSSAQAFGIPLAVLLELTHRCPLQCPYCSNPLALERGSDELTTDEWRGVLGELADIGVLQVHLSGGEPTARRDLLTLTQHASDLGLYTNLITSAVLLTRDKLAALAEAGLCHVQISVQGSEAALADRIAGLGQAHSRKLKAARWTRELGLPLTINAVMHRQTMHQLPEIIAMAQALGAARLEIANVQYYGWALENRAALMPSFAQIEEAGRVVDDAARRLQGVMAIDYVVPDYYATRPKTCMGGWGRQFFNISPSGKVLPCHAAESLTGLHFESVRDGRSIAEIWRNSEALNRFRGTGWMREPCASCVFKESDFGGCRCQAFALSGDAANTDPACTLSPHHAATLSGQDAAVSAADFIYRNYANAAPRAVAQDEDDART